MIYYIDPSASVNGNGLSESSPFNVCPYLYPTSIPSDTVLLFKSGTTHIVSSYIYAGAKSNIRISSYGVGRAILKNTNTTPAQVFHILNCSNVEVDNIEIDGLGLGHHGILTQVSNTNQYDNVYIHDNDIYNCSKPNPLEVADENTSAGIYYSTLYLPITNYKVTHNIVHNCYASGIHNVGSVDGSYFAHNKLHDNCSQQGSHNLSGHPHRATYTSGWTLVSGTTYSRTFTNNDVFIVNCGYPDGTYLAKNTVTQTTPSANEFGWSAGVLYINFATNPNTITTGITYSEFKNFVIEYNESYGAINWLPYPYDEGHGVALDDWAGPGVIRYNYIHDNQGLGISCNKGFGNQIYRNILVNNALGGITAWHDSNVYNNTFVNNGAPDVATSRQVWLVKKLGISLNNPSALSYNIFYCRNNQAYLVSATNQVCKNNLLYNYFATNAWGGLVTTGVITPNPLLDSDYKPQAIQCYGYGEKWWGTNARPDDAYGNPTPDVGIDIGAVQGTSHPFHPSNM